MKKIILFTVTLLIIALLGCSGGGVATTSSIPGITKSDPNPGIILDMAKQEKTAMIEESLENAQWISPGKVNVANFHIGASADYHITIHNGVAKRGNTVELDLYLLKVTTDPDETQAEIPLKYKLYGDYKDILIKSDNPKDNLKVISSSDDGMAIMISGFSPNDTRIMTLGYLQYAKFAVMYRTPDHALEGYMKAPKDLVQDWVIIADTSPVFEPWETRDIAITLAMPENIGPDDTTFYEITNSGTARINTIAKEQLPILENVYLSENNEYQSTSDIDIKRDIEEKARTDANKNLIEYLDKEIPEASLLLFLNKNSSVSEKLIINKKYQTDLIEYITNQGYAVKGNLLTDQWEFWISVMDVTKQQQVATEMCSRWLISMR